MKLTLRLFFKNPLKTFAIMELKSFNSIYGVLILSFVNLKRSDDPSLACSLVACLNSI